MIVGGLFLAFLGRKLFVAAIFLISFFVTMTGILLLFYSTFLKDNTEDWVGWTVLGGSAVVGLIVGYFMTRQSMQRIGAAILAAWGGFIVGLILNESVLYLTDSTAVFWCVAIGCAIAAAIFAFVAYNHALILSTALIGSYSIVRGASLYIGGFPNEFNLINEVKNGVIENVPWEYYAYLAAIIATSILASIVQYKTLARMEEHERHPYERLR